MRILIAGGAGEVGRHLAKDFSRQGNEIRVLDRAPGTKEIEGPVHGPGRPICECASGLLEHG